MFGAIVSVGVAKRLISCACGRFDGWVKSSRRETFGELVVGCQEFGARLLVARFSGESRADLCEKRNRIGVAFGAEQHEEIELADNSGSYVRN